MLSGIPSIAPQNFFIPKPTPMTDPNAPGPFLVRLK
jgi:hypothetical protein